MNKDKKIEYKGKKQISDLVIATTDNKIFLSLNNDEYVYGVEYIEKKQVIFCLSKKYLSEYEESNLKGLYTTHFSTSADNIKLYAHEKEDLSMKAFEQDFPFQKGNYALQKILKNRVVHGVLITPTEYKKTSNVSLDSGVGDLIGDVASDNILDMAGDLIGGIIEGIFNS